MFCLFFLVLFFFFFFFFFFSRRRRHTRFDCDWSSDVCSSDLRLRAARADQADPHRGRDVVRDTDVVVIGAGIYGCSTAYFLARLGVPVTIVDAEDLGAGASGANAGNLHLQLSPFSHATKDEAWIAEFARTLPFFIQALALWKALATELDADIEFRCPGG